MNIRERLEQLERQTDPEPGRVRRDIDALAEAMKDPEARAALAEQAYQHADAADQRRRHG